jgi:hypothetical protein
MMQRSSWIAASALVFMAACSDSGATAANHIGGRTMSATVDGTAWSTTTLAGSLTNGVVSIVGVNGNQTIGISFAATSGPQPIAQTSVVAASLAIGTLTWGAGPGTGTGTVTVTTATDNHFVGTFSFTAQALASGTTPATHQVTAGTFDVTF